MLKRKAFNRIFFSTIIFFLVFGLYSLKLVDNKVYKKYNNYQHETLYTLNSDNYISETIVYVGKVFTLEDKIKEKLEIMTKENNKNALLPSYFKPILPEGTKVLDVKVKDNLVKVYFSKELENITQDQSESMIEAIVYTITNENILGIEIYVENSLLKYVPNTKKEIPTLLTKEFGINKEYNISNYNDVNKVITYYFTKCGYTYCAVPITKYINDSREKLEIIFDELLKVNPNKSLISLLENIIINNYSIDKKTITIDTNKELNDEEIDLISKSLFDNYQINKIVFLVNKEKKYEKNR